MAGVLRNPTSQNDLPNIRDSDYEKAEEQSRDNERDLCSSFHGEGCAKGREGSLNHEGHEGGKIIPNAALLV